MQYRKAVIRRLIDSSLTFELKMSVFPTNETLKKRERTMLFTFDHIQHNKNNICIRIKVSQQDAYVNLYIGFKGEIIFNAFIKQYNNCLYHNYSLHS